MTPIATPFFFYLLSGLALLGGILVITRRNAVHSALALILTLLALAGLYLMLYAPFVAFVLICVDTGGTMVVSLFVIMLVSIERSQKEEQFNKQWTVGFIAAGVLGVLFVLVYVKGRALLPAPTAQIPNESQNTQNVGVLLYREYMFAFEIASLLLLVAIIGAVVMAKKRI